MNTAALDLLLTRRTVPSAFLAEPGPSRSELETLITVAVRVPDHGKLTPWRYIALDRSDRTALWPKMKAIRLADVPDVPAVMLDKEEAAFLSSPLCLVAVNKAADHPKIPVWEQDLSVGASVMNLMIAAHAMGYSAQWLTGWSAEHAKTKALFNVGADETIAGFVHIGTPNVPPSERPRPAITDVLSFWSDDKAND